MKLAIIGSRNIQNIDISPYIPEGVTEIISGGANGVDSLAERYADYKRLSKHIIRPQYDKYPAKAAPIKRNDVIIATCDQMLAFWDGESKGTSSIITKMKKTGKPVIIIEIKL